MKVLWAIQYLPQDDPCCWFLTKGKQEVSAEPPGLGLRANSGILMFITDPSWCCCFSILSFTLPPSPSCKIMRSPNSPLCFSLGWSSLHSSCFWLFIFVLHSFPFLRVSYLSHLLPPYTLNLPSFEPSRLLGITLIQPFGIKASWEADGNPSQQDALPWCRAWAPNWEALAMSSPRWLEYLQTAPPGSPQSSPCARICSCLFHRLPSTMLSGLLAAGVAHCRSADSKWEFHCWVKERGGNLER